MRIRQNAVELRKRPQQISALHRGLGQHSGMNLAVKRIRHLVEELVPELKYCGSN